jgi:hypothetical protein
MFGMARKAKDGLSWACKACCCKRTREQRGRLLSRSKKDIILEGYKRCGLCKKLKAKTEYYIRLDTTSGLSWSCKICRAEYDHVKTMETRKHHRERMAESRRGEWCQVCGEDNPNILEFDHVDPATKTANLSSMANRKDGRFYTEKTGTQVLCVTCHRRKSALQRRAQSKPQQERRGEDKYAQRNKAYIRKRKLEIGECQLCHKRPDLSGDIDIELATFDFDHVDRENKKMPVGIMVYKNFSIRTLDAEIAKCRLLCAACHMLHTREQLGWVNYGDSPSKNMSEEEKQRLSRSRGVTDALIAAYGFPTGKDGPMSRVELCNMVQANYDGIFSRITMCF